MTKTLLTDLDNLQNDNTATAAINANNAVIEAAFDNTLSRDGSIPNQMGALIDMNSNSIINLPTPTTLYEPLRVIDRTTLNGGGTIPVSPLPLAGTTGQVLMKNSGTNFDASWKAPYPVGGTIGQVLRKNSSADFDTSWYSPTGSSTGGGNFINILNYGGDPTNTGYNDAAFAAAWAALDVNGCGCIYFPAGVYKFQSAVNKTIKGPAGSVTICGDGPKATQFHFVNATNGLIFNQGDYRVNICLRDFSVTTAQQGIGTGITLQSIYIAINPTSWSQVQNIMVHGDDYGSFAYQNFWGTAIKIHVWSQINFINVNTYGKGAPGGGGSTGVFYEGNQPTGEYGVLYGFQQCSFNYHNIGMRYGDYIQGVTVNMCNFNGGSGGTAVFSAGGGTGVGSQLAISNSQFDYKGSCLSINTGIYDVMLQNNIFSVSSINAQAVQLPQAVQFTCVGNKFLNYDRFTYTGTVGMVVGGTATCGTIVGNSFVGLSMGYNLQPGTNNISAIGNSFLNTTTPYSNTGSSQTPGIAETAHVMP